MKLTAPAAAEPARTLRRVATDEFIDMAILLRRELAVSEMALHLPAADLEDDR